MLKPGSPARRFAAALLFLGALAGVLLLNKWLLAVGLLLAFLYTILPRILDAATRYQNYPKLLNQVVELREAVTELKADNAELRTAADAAVGLGIDEGMRRVLGELRATLAPPIQLQSVSEINGTLVLVANYTVADDDTRVPAVMARYAVVDSLAEVRKGVVEVTRVEVDRKLVFLECIEVNVEPFWQQLQERAAADSTAPAHTRLDPVTYDFPRGAPRIVPSASGRELEANE